MRGGTGPSTDHATPVLSPASATLTGKMRVKVLFFGMLKDIVGRSEDHLELPDGGSVGSIFEHYAALFPQLREMSGSIVLAKNHEFSPAGEFVGEGDEIAL